MKSIKDKIKEFEKYLRLKNLSKNSIESYAWTMNYFFSNYDKINKETLLDYKVYLTDHFKPNTINQRIAALSHWIDFEDLNPKLKLKPVKIQEKMFLENVISQTDYEFLKQELLKDNKLDAYYIVWALGATGARVSELVQLKYEHFKEGHYDVYSKGGKYRRLYIPKTLAKSILKWLEKTQNTQGYVFKGIGNSHITTRGISRRLKDIAKKYGVNQKVVYPHSFRHMFAKNFLKKENDIAFLADLMGHDSIDTTRIYLRKTSEEQRALVDKIITW